MKSIWPGWGGEDSDPEEIKENIDPIERRKCVENRYRKWNDGKVSYYCGFCHDDFTYASTLKEHLRHGCPALINFTLGK